MKLRWTPDGQGDLVARDEDLSMDYTIRSITRTSHVLTVRADTPTGQRIVSEEHFTSSVPLIKRAAQDLVDAGGPQ